MVVLHGQLTECTCKPARGKQANLELQYHRDLSIHKHYTVCPVTADQVMHAEHFKTHSDWFKRNFTEKENAILTGTHTAPSVPPWAFLLLGFHQD